MIAYNAVTAAAVLFTILAAAEIIPKKPCNGTNQRSCDGIYRSFSPDKCSVFDGKFECWNGQCIDEKYFCDGVPDCTDGSDEKAEHCDVIYCPEEKFQCKYGACIDQRVKCNGKQDCADGSDEDPKLCGKLLKKNCKVPEQPENGELKLEESHCDTPDDCKLPKGTLVDPGTVMSYMCNEGYKVKGNSELFCFSSGRWSKIPKCEKVHCTPLVDATREAQCSYKGDRASCESPANPGTKAFNIRCRNGYRTDTTAITRMQNVECNSTGMWQPKPIECLPDCGILPTDLYPLIVNGKFANVKKFPWHATLYKMENKTIEFKCGATIIAENLVVTAAHCIYDTVLKKAQSASLFYVATGNFYREYNHSENHPGRVKKSQVKNIYMHCRYLDLEGNYGDDIAILQLVTPFIFNAITVPACLDNDKRSDAVVLESGNYGKVAGFGKTIFGKSSAILQTIDVPYVTFSECNDAAGKPTHSKFITYDKFCAGYRNGSSVCEGDSGGGLVFKTDGKWYLRGIVSVGIRSKKIKEGIKCDPNQYGAYTKVSEHIEWIQKVMVAVKEGKKSAEYC